MNSIKLNQSLIIKIAVGIILVVAGMIALFNYTNKKASSDDDDMEIVSLAGSSNTYKITLDANGGDRIIPDMLYFVEK